jgi:ATP-dependent Clp protease, protease subunit
LLSHSTFPARPWEPNVPTKGRRGDVPPALLDPQVRLIGVVDYDLVRSLVGQLAELSEEHDEVAIELTTPGGDADLARRMVHEIETWQARRKSRLLFLGVSQVHSAGVTFMAAFPPEHRFLTRDTILLIHGRRLERRIELSGPLRGTLAHLRSLTSQVELGIALEEEGFEQLIRGSDIGFDEIVHHSRFNWYIRAEEALERGLVAGLL